LSKEFVVSQAVAGSLIGSNRIVPRYPFEARFKIRIDRSGNIVETEGWARDLSESGLGAFVAATIEVGESATLRIPLSVGQELVIPAKVARRSGTECGFRFTALSSGQRGQILSAIAGKKAMPYTAGV